MQYVEKEREVVLEVAQVPSPIELARQIQAIGNRVAVVEEHVVSQTRQGNALNSLVADQGELIITTRTVVSGTRGEVDRLQFGLGTTETRVERLADQGYSLDRRLGVLEGEREGRLTINAVVGFGFMGTVLVLGLWSLNSRITATQAQDAARLQAIETAIGVQQNELARAREQQRVDAQYLVNELAKKRSR